MSDIWYYADQNGHVGPMTLQQLKQTLATTSNPADMLVWCDKFPDWKWARELPELSAYWATPSQSSFPQGPAHTDDKRVSWLRQRALSVFAPVSLLTYVRRPIWREQIQRLSAELGISKLLAPWFRESHPAVIERLRRAVKANLVFVVIAAVCVCYGIYDGVLLNSPVSGLLAGILSAGIISLLVASVRKYRVKKPTRLLIWIGNVAYWLGWALASYGIFLMVYQISHVGLSGGLKAISSILPSVIFYPAVGWSIRYMLGR